MGTAAVENGLVDSDEGFYGAMVAIKERLGLEEDARLTFDTYPKAGSGVRQLIDAMQGGPFGLEIPARLSEVLEWSQMAAADAPLAMLPFLVQVK